MLLSAVPTERLPNIRGRRDLQVETEMNTRRRRSLSITHSFDVLRSKLLLAVRPSPASGLRRNLSETKERQKAGELLNIG